MHRWNLLLHHDWSNVVASQLVVLGMAAIAIGPLEKGGKD